MIQISESILWASCAQNWLSSMCFSFSSSSQLPHLFLFLPYCPIIPSLLFLFPSFFSFSFYCPSFHHFLLSPCCSLLFQFSSLPYSLIHLSNHLPFLYFTNLFLSFSLPFFLLSSQYIHILGMEINLPVLWCILSVTFMEAFKLISILVASTL